jgi:hypothetical protein
MDEVKRFRNVLESRSINTLLTASWDSAKRVREYFQCRKYCYRIVSYRICIVFSGNFPVPYARNPCHVRAFYFIFCPPQKKTCFATSAYLVNRFKISALLINELKYIQSIFIAVILSPLIETNWIVSVLSLLYSITSNGVISRSVDWCQTSDTTLQLIQ